MKNVTDFCKTVVGKRCGSASAVCVYNKHSTTWKVLCTVLRHPSIMSQISHSFAALTHSIYDTSASPGNIL